MSFSKSFDFEKDSSVVIKDDAAIAREIDDSPCR